MSDARKMDFWLEEDKNKRRHIPEDWKIKVRKRQKDRCADCGEPFTLDRRPKFDHKLALGLGGSHTLRNIQALCPRCNDNKTRADRAKIAKKKRKEEEEPVDVLGLGPLFSSPRRRRRK